RSEAFGLNARPGDGEPICLRAKTRDQVEILGPTVIVVTRDVGVVSVADPPCHRAERVPCRDSASVLLGRSLDLKGGRGDAPLEFGRKFLNPCHRDLPEM